MKLHAKRAIALILAVLAVILLAACGTKGGSPDETTTVPEGSSAVPQGNTSAPGATDADGQPLTIPEHTGGASDDKIYSSPKKIETIMEGEDYTGGDIPDGVAEIFSVDGKLLFTYVTRCVGNAETKTTSDYYTLFEYNTGNGSCKAVSPEVGYIMRVGDRFLYDKSGVPVGSANYWDVPYYTNNSSWTDEQQITGAEAVKLISAPKTALIKGKQQAYAIQRSGLTLTVTLPESGEVLTCTMDPKDVFGTKTLDGFMVDIRGISNETIYLSISFVPESGGYVKELCALPLGGGKLVAIRYGDASVWVDPLCEIQNDVLYGYTIHSNKSRSLLRIDTTSGAVQLLTKTNDHVFHCVANGTHVLYEIPKSNGESNLECKAIEVS